MVNGKTPRRTRSSTTAGEATAPQKRRGAHDDELSTSQVLQMFAMSAQQHMDSAQQHRELAKQYRDLTELVNNLIELNLTQNRRIRDLEDDLQNLRRGQDDLAARVDEMIAQRDAQQAE